MKRYLTFLMVFLLSLTCSLWAAAEREEMDPMDPAADIADAALYSTASGEEFTSRLLSMVHRYEGSLTTSKEGNSLPQGGEYAAARLLVSADSGLAEIGDYHPAEILTNGEGFYAIQFSSSADAEKCNQYLNGQSGVIFAEPDRIVALGPEEHGAEEPLLPNAPLLSWGVSGTKMDAFAALLKGKGLSSHIVAAVVDTGADTGHTFLQGRLTDGRNLVEDGTPMRDGNGHGTHVSGTIVEATKGLNIFIMPVRVMYDAGWGYSSVIASGIRYAADHGANVINLSLGGGHSSCMDEAIAYAVGKNITVVAAAGNENDNTDDHCPAHIPDAITVAAVDSGWQRASFSNFGKAVDIAAPGVDICSSIPGEKYARWSGTSMAAPHVSAASALLLYQNPAMTPKQVEDELCGAAIDRGDVGRDKEYGAGTLSMQKWIPGGTLVREGKFGENDSLTWSQYSDSTLIISGQGAMPDYTDKEHAPWYEYRAGIKKVVIESGVTNIGNYAFENYGDLVDITISDTVLSIGKRAFAKCSSLESVAIPDSVITIVGGAFNTCSNLSALTLGEGLVTIGDHAFNACEKLTEVILPDSLTSVEYAAFAACHGLTTFKTGANTRYTVVDGVLFSKDLKTLVIYPAGKGASYIVPEGTAAIGMSAFESAANVTSVALPNSLTSIGYYAFVDTGLTSIKFPDGLEKIDGYAFRNCDGLTDVAIPASVTSISGNPFYWSGNLKEFRVDKNNARYCDVDGVLFTKDMKTLCAYPIGKTDTTYTVPNGISIIGGDSFITCKLTSVILPDGVTEIKDQAFWGCGNLESVALPGSLKKIAWSFPYCGKLTDVYYGGNAEQWKAIEITPGNGNSNSILKATVHYPQIAVGTAEARPGESVEIPISLELNPGLTAMRLQVAYDKNALTLEGVTDGGKLGSESHNTDYSLNPYTLFWNNQIAKENFTADGTIATLKFKVASGAADGDYPISVSYDSAALDILNRDMNPVGFDLLSGGVTVTHILYGDVNDNKSVGVEDPAYLDRNLAGWKGYETIQNENADVDLDRAVTVRDSMIIARNVASWTGFETLPYPITASGASLLSDREGVIRVGTASGAPGSTTSVTLSLEDNPGLAMMRLFVSYDESVLELQKVTDAGMLGAAVHCNDYSRNPYPLFWNNGTAKEDYAVNGTVATLTFRIREDAPEQVSPVTVSYGVDQKDILDHDLNPVAFRTEGGSVAVTFGPAIKSVNVESSPDESGGRRITAVVSQAESGAVVWCSLYQQSGKCVGSLSQDAAAGKQEYVFYPEREFDYAKIFVLDTGFRPLCDYMMK